MRRLISAIIGLMCTCWTWADDAHSLLGPWHGTLDAGAVKLSLVIHVSPDSVTLDSPDQGAFGIPGRLDVLTPDSLALAVPRLGVVCRAALGSDGSLHGVFQQGWTSMPLVLSRGEFVRERPQTPRPPFPYSEQEVAFHSSVDSARLVGTLTIPAGPDSPRLLVVMINGSGQQNRDEEIFGHKPFAVIADHLARHGIASFRYDDRGTGMSEGLTPLLDIHYTCADALSAFDAVKPLVDAPAIGFLGHSEGAIASFMALRRRPADVQFIVTLGAPAVSGDSILRSQIQRLEPSITPDELDRRILAACRQSPWMDSFVNYPYVQDIALDVDTPTLALFGALDTQVDPALNVPAMRRLLAPNTHATILVLPGLNHLMQPAVTGLPDEYTQIPTTVAPEALSTITSWLLSLHL